MGSSRFPGKVLRDLNGKPVLLQLINRLKKSKKIDKIVVATSTNPLDEKIRNFCCQEGIFYYQGDEEDVLRRVYNAARLESADYCVDITADCPVVDPKQIDEAIRYIKFHKMDYVSNVVFRDWPDGFDFQVYSFEILRQLFFLVPYRHRSHVGWNTLQYTSLLEMSLGRKLKIKHLPKANKKYHRPEWGLTLDEPDDLELLREIFFHYDDNPPSAEKIIDYILKNIEILDINKSVRRNVPGM
jgi:spore coat polysaccharide biosynthesis protein SpsF (cytidylyltransferase family)